MPASPCCSVPLTACPDRAPCRLPSARPPACPSAPRLTHTLASRHTPHEHATRRTTHASCHALAPSRHTHLALHASRYTPSPSRRQHRRLCGDAPHDSRLRALPTAHRGRGRLSRLQFGQDLQHIDASHAAELRWLVPLRYPHPVEHVWLRLRWNDGSGGVHGKRTFPKALTGALALTTAMYVLPLAFCAAAVGNWD